MTFEVSRLTKEKEKRENENAIETQSKEMLSKEKHELVQQANELQHQLELLKTQKQTEQHKADQHVRDA